MRHTSSQARTLAAAACFACTLTSQAQFQAPPPPAIHRLSLGYSMSFNLQADFRNTGRTPASAPGDAIAGSDHTYDDGYVRVDASQNAGGLTWNWGYQSPGQLSGDQLSFSASRPGVLENGVRDELAHGLELRYAGRLGNSARSSWGIEAAFCFVDSSFRSSAEAAHEVLTVDSYSLGGIVPPAAPYSGTYAGPGPLISDAPETHSVMVESKLDTQFYNLRVGPYVELPLGSRTSLSFSGGLALTVADSQLAFRQQPDASVPDLLSTSGSSSQATLLAGGYLAADVSARITRSTGVFLALQYQNSGRFSVEAGDKEAELDLRGMFSLTAGMRLFF